MNKDYEYDGQISGTDITVQQPESSGRQFLALLGQGVADGINQIQKEPEERLKKNREKLTYYNELRAAGYSPEEATARVNKDTQGSFFERIAKKSGAFTAPQNDAVAREQKKQDLDNKKTEADIELSQSKSTYYKNGGAKRTVIDRMTPNQLQGRLKYLNDLVSIETDDETIRMIKEEIDYVNQKIQEVSGYKKPAVPGAAAATDAPPAVGAKIKVRRKSDGATGSIVATDFDPAKYDKV